MGVPTPRGGSAAAVPVKKAAPRVDDLAPEPGRGHLERESDLLVLVLRPVLGGLARGSRRLSAGSTAHVAQSENPDSGRQRDKIT